MMTRKIIGNERGSVMSIALLFLILLTSLVMFMSRSSTTNVQIAGNEKAATVAFYAADAGAYASAKVVGKAIDDAGTPSFGNAGDDYPNVTFIVNAGNATGGNFDFYDQVIFGNADLDTLMDPSSTAGRGDEDIEFSINGRIVKVGVTRTGSKGLAGGGAEFGAGSMGVGAGSSGGVAIYYDARAVGAGPKNAREEINVQYRKIPGTAGGL
jgi:hypothetical protein